jgi:hypothetical protein
MNPEELKRLADMLTSPCKCTHSFGDHYKPTRIHCDKCQCKKFVPMSNMEWLAYQGKLIPWYKRLFKRLVNKI